ncbi:hypothetical protein COB55_03880 [Candidatus Wolfebacteria bacterium]|nr:MAG: hypothetical protein COB55_03880 [Candidatus Wolfebacteria bacterium]
MKLTHEIVKEIADYLLKNEWLSNGYGYNDFLETYGGSFILRINLLQHSDKYKSRNMVSSPGYDEIISKYFLEYVGYFLRKHSITEVYIYKDKYKSKTWGFKDIKLIQT